MVVERAFGLLKNRWRITLKLMEMNLENAVRCITASCVLHNFCILNGDEFDIPNGWSNPNIYVDNVLLDKQWAIVPKMQ